MQILAPYLGCLLNRFCCRNKQGKEGYLPANYVAETAPLVQKKTVQKKVVETVPVQVKKTRTVKKVVPGSKPRLTATRTLKRLSSKEIKFRKLFSRKICVSWTKARSESF